MAKQRSPESSTTDRPQPERAKRNVTPPKGRPTRARNSSGVHRRAFGPVAQWVTVALLIALIVVVLVLITDGGDFNPFNDEDQLPSQFGAAAALA